VRQKLLSITQTLRLPLICFYCNQFHKGRMALCDQCIDVLPTLGPRCQHCAYPLEHTSYLLCGHCIKNTPAFDKAIIYYRFEEPLRRLIHQFKYENGLYLANLLSHLMLNAWYDNPSQAECLIPVPMHSTRIKHRGYNQAMVLTKILAKKVNLPYKMRICQKILNTPPQASLAKNERQQNLKNAFQIESTPYQHVVLIDDILTTGNTANEMASALKKAGVEKVDIWCCARTI
jgi:ComF family protein